MPFHLLPDGHPYSRPIGTMCCACDFQLNWRHRRRRLWWDGWVRSANRLVMICSFLLDLSSKLDLVRLAPSWTGTNVVWVSTSPTARHRGGGAPILYVHSIGRVFLIFTASLTVPKPPMTPILHERVSVYYHHTHQPYANLSMYSHDTHKAGISSVLYMTGNAQLPGTSTFRRLFFPIFK